MGAAWGTAAAEPAGLLAWRYLLTAALLLAVVPLIGFGLTRREFGQQCVLGLTAHVAFLGALFTASAAGVDAGTTALICSAQPLLVAAAGAMLWKDRMSCRQWLGVGLGLVAVAICMGGVSGLGVALILPVISLLGLSCSALLERRWRPEVHVVTSLTVQVSVAAVVFVVVAVLTTGMAVDPTARLAASLAWLVFPAGLGGYGAYLLALRHLGATRTSALLYLTPPVSGVWAWAMLGDGLGGTQLVAMALGMVAVVLAAGPREGTHTPTAPPVTEDRRGGGLIPGVLRVHDVRIVERVREEAHVPVEQRQAEHDPGHAEHPGDHDEHPADRLVGQGER